MKKLAYLSTPFFLIVATYFIVFPNDFFLPKNEFIQNKNLYCYEQSFSRFTLFNKTLASTQLLDIIKSPDSYLNEKKSIIKNNEKRTIAKLEIDSGTIILKRYNFKGVYDWITKCPFRSSKAYRAWYYQHKLLEHGVATTKPIAIIEKRCGPFWLQTYIISEYIEGKPLSSEQAQLNPSSYKPICKQLIKYLNVFYHLKLLHRDLVARNLIINGENIAIIDLDEMHSYTFNNTIFKKKFAQKHYYKFINRNLFSQDFIKIFLMTHNQLSDYNAETNISEDLI